MVNTFRFFLFNLKVKGSYPAYAEVSLSRHTTCSNIVVVVEFTACGKLRIGKRYVSELLKYSFHSLEDCCAGTLPDWHIVLVLSTI